MQQGSASSTFDTRSPTAEAPTLMGAMNLAALNIANAIGAWAGSVTIAAGYGLLSAVWAGFGLTLLGLLVFALTLPKAPQFAPADCGQAPHLVEWRRAREVA